MQGTGGPLKLVLASANPKKAAEIAEIVSSAWPDEVELVPRPADLPEVVEDSESFGGNARLKAVALVTATGLPALADDSGLAVDALDGAPGVRSARYAGDDATDSDNVSLLLRNMEEVQDADRTARFVCVLVLRWPDGRELVAEGSVEGVIARSPSGSGGFGYDPVFVPVIGDGRTFAEMPADEKHLLSHRGRALRALATALHSLGTDTTGD